MEKRFLSLVLSLLLVDVVCAQEPVQFADPALKAAVENELWITDPTPTDMLGLISLTADVNNLAGLEYATNLEQLWVGQDSGLTSVAPLAGLSRLRVVIVNNNDIPDLSPLAGLTNLEHLDVHEMGVSDISSLAGLVHLRYLNMHQNMISDISPLAGMSNLDTLIAGWNQIEDISPLYGLSRLNTLNLEYNQISAISVLSAMNGLDELNLSYNLITDVSPLIVLTSLRNLWLGGNPRSEETCSVSIPQIRASNPGVYIDHECGPFTISVSSGPGGSVVEPGEGVFTYEYGQTVQLEARADPPFAFAGWSGTICTSQNPQTFLATRHEQLQASFVSALDVIHVDGDEPGSPGPGVSTESNPAEDGTREHPFNQIAKAIEVAANGATIYLYPGTYGESIDPLDKSIKLTGANPDDPNEMSWPVIQGKPGKPVVTITSSRDVDCLLHGLVLTGGMSARAGAVLCPRGRLTMANCLIVGNRASDPASAAIYCTGNSDVTIINCTVADNHTGSFGAIISARDSRVTVANSILWGHPWREISLLDTGQASASYSAVAGGWPGPGCTNADPLFAGAGYWANPSDPGEVLSPYNPAAVWVLGDYHLRSLAGRWDPRAGNWVQDAVTSPCIDAGDPNSPVGGEPSPNGGLIDMGVYGGTAEASKSGAAARVP